MHVIGKSAMAAAKTGSADALSVALFSAREANAQSRELIERTYAMWTRLWSDTFRELDGSDALDSDDFTRADRVCVLLHEREPIGSVSFLRVKLDEPHWLDDSALAAWPKSELARLAKVHRGQPVLVGCSFALDPTARREAIGVSAKRLLLAITIEHLLNSDCAAMLGTARIDRGMHTASHAIGGKKVALAKLHGVDVELLHWRKTEVAANAHGFPLIELAHGIYQSRIDLTQTALTIKAA